MIYSKIEMMVSRVLTENSATLTQNVLYADNKKLWKSVKPLFSNKIIVKGIINLTENREILRSDTDS